MGYNEIRHNRDGALDEVCLENVNVHLEQMHERCWWLGLYRGDQRVVVWFNVEKGRLVAHVGEDEIGLPTVPSYAP